jgi:hypothetical protein
MTKFPPAYLAFVLALLLSRTAVGAPSYGLEYHLDLSAAPELARVSLTVSQDDGTLRQLNFHADDTRFAQFDAGENLTREGERYEWRVPPKGGTLSWRAPITHARGGGALDARLGKRWALFRGEDAFPAMASRTLKGAESNARLTVALPPNWTFVTAWPEADQGYALDNPARRFDRPTGWMIAGRLGVRIDRIAGVRSTVAAPRGQNVRRQDILAMLNWSLPDLVRLLPSFPTDLLVVSADDPFWRGGLSGPSSLYLHAQRPLISENGTSTLLHELFHVGFARAGGSRDDWIVEGLAEYYSVVLLRRAGTVTASRHAKTLRSLARWAKQSGPLRGARSSGARTARAVGVFVALDDEIRKQSDGQYSLDDVVRRLASGDGALSLDELRATVRELTAVPSKVLSRVASTKTAADRGPLPRLANLPAAGRTEAAAATGERVGASAVSP